MWWRNRNVLLLLSIGLALPAGQAAPYLKPLVLPALGVVMTLALLGISGEAFRSPKKMVAPVLTGLAMNFGLHGGLVLALNALLISHEPFATGFVLVAAVPPAVAVVPFAVLLHGDREFALFATIGCYLAALAITPLMAVGLLGTAFIHPGKIIEILGLLIALPLIISRVLRRTGLTARLEPLKGALTNWSFALITYTIVGLNRSLIMDNPLALITPMAIGLIVTFLLGWGISFVARLAGLKRETTVTLMLLGTLKNAALAGGLALSLFGKATAVPATVCAIFLIIYFIWLSFLHERGSDSEENFEGGG